jgi:hypothetical protein
MTTVEAEHAFVVYKTGKSCLDLYTLACHENGVRPNSALLKMLPSQIDFFDVRTLDLRSTYLGPVGVHCLIDVIRANTLLLELNLAHQGADDVTVAAVVTAIRNHERLGTISFAQNPEVTRESAPLLITLMRENKMITKIDIQGTKMGLSVQRTMDRIGNENALLEANFFKGDFVRMKRTFCELDSEGNGKISVGALLTQIEIPQVATALEKRFATVDHGPTTDGYLDMCEFLRFTYPDFISEPMIREHVKRADADDETIVENWKIVLEALRRGRMEFRGLHLVRIFHRVITVDEAIKLVRQAMENMWHDGLDSVMTSEGKVQLPPECVCQATEQLFGAEMQAINERRAIEWGCIRITPGIARLMLQAFLRAAKTPDFVVEGTTQLVDTSLGAILDDVVSTETTFLDSRIIAAKLKKAGVGRSINFSFPEWITYVNESLNIALYPVCHPASFSVAAIAGQQDAVLDG